jgi:DNA modification methylase
MCGFSQEGYIVYTKFCSPFPWFGGNQKATNLIVILFNKRNTVHLQIQTVKYPHLPSAIRPVPHIEESPVTKPPGNQTFSDHNSYSDEDHGEQEEDNVDCSPKLVASCSSSEPHLLTQKDLNNLVRDLKLTNKLIS